jgi:hypothetical protein
MPAGYQAKLSDDEEEVPEANTDMETNILNKRDKAISEMLKKEDLGLI